jgi:glucose-6-phosphate-specific signal transduction histidine kinase
VAASLSRALADPDLLIRTFQPDTGWTDDRGRPVADPEAERGGRAVTEVATGSGGRVVLLHGPKGAGDTEPARAAARAAALALESVRVEALVRRQARDARRSAARLVTVDDIQRRVLAERLRAGPIARLERLRRSGPDGAADPFDAEIDRIVDDLHRMAQGLNPAALAGGRPLREALQELAGRADVPIDCEIAENLEGLPDETVALVYYTASECLTNVAKHACAGAARLRVRLDPSTLVLDVHDDGRGGAAATPGGGLQGLVDRVALAGGTVRIDSPVGGPTSIHVEVPLTPDAPR